MRLDPRAGGSFSADGHFQIAFDATSLDTYMQCPRKYKLRIREGWRPKSGSAALLYGQARHAAHEVYAGLRARGVGREEALDAAVQKALEVSWADGVNTLDFLASIGPRDGQKKRTRWNLTRSVVWWAEEFGDEDDPVQTVILPDGRPAVELSWMIPLAERAPTGETYMLSGHFDRLVTYAGQPFVDEYKHTTTSLSKFYFGRYSPNVQVSTYAAAARVLLPGGAKGVLLEAEQLGVGFSRFERDFAHRSTGQNNEWLRTAVDWIKRAELDASREAAGDPEAFPMNETACGNYGGCPFRGVCNKSPEVREKFLAADFDREEPWDPLKTRGD